MRIGITATIAAAGGLMAAGTLGVATAEAPTSTSLRTVSVQGVASEAIDQGASMTTADAVYRQGMGDAIADGLSKAQLLAGKVGASLGPVQSVAEGGGYIGCPGETEYAGAQPDFGASSGPVSAGAPVRAGATLPPQHSRKHTRRRRNTTPTAKAGATCTLYTQVSLTYLLG